jgi:hypothetical protein
MHRGNPPAGRSHSNGKVLVWTVIVAVVMPGFPPAEKVAACFIFAIFTL